MKVPKEEKSKKTILMEVEVNKLDVSLNEELKKK